MNWSLRSQIFNIALTCVLYFFIDFFFLIHNLNFLIIYSSFTYVILLILHFFHSFTCHLFLSSFVFLISFLIFSSWLNNSNFFFYYFLFICFSFNSSLFSLFNLISFSRFFLSYKFYFFFYRRSIEFVRHVSSFYCSLLYCNSFCLLSTSFLLRVLLLVLLIQLLFIFLFF